jgi:hypothetical protein
MLFLWIPAAKLPEFKERAFNTTYAVGVFAQTAMAFAPHSTALRAGCGSMEIPIFLFVLATKPPKQTTVSSA